MIRLLLLACFLIGDLARTAASEEWPTRPVRIVNTFAPGSASDILARMVADHMSAAFKQQFFVETRSGAGGIIGMQTVGHSPPDGYNFVITTIGLTTLYPIAKSNIGYDAMKDFTHVAYIAGSPGTFVTNPKSGLKTLADFVRAGKERSRPLTFGSSGLLSVGPMLAFAFERATGTKLQIVPYKGASQSMLDVIANTIDFATPSVTAASSQLQSGAVIGVAQSSATRLLGFPGIPTFKEQGYDFEETSWFGLAGPAGLSKEIVDKVNRAVIEAMMLPEHKQRMNQDAMSVRPLSSSEFTRFIEAENVRWKPLLEQAGLVEK